MRSRRTCLKIALAFGLDQKSCVAVILLSLFYCRSSLRVQQQTFPVVLAQQFLTCIEKPLHHLVGPISCRMVVCIRAISTCIEKVPLTSAYPRGLFEKGTLGRAHTFLNDHATSLAVPAFRNCHYITSMQDDSHDLGWDDPASNSLVGTQLV